MNSRVLYTDEGDFGDPARVAQAREMAREPPLPVAPRLSYREVLEAYHRALLARDPISVVLREELRAMRRAREEVRRLKKQKKRLVRLTFGKHDDGPRRSNCAGCGVLLLRAEVILDRATGRSWHPECFVRRVDPPKGWPVAYRIKMAGAPGSHSNEEWLAVLADYNNCCAYCGTDKRPMTKDHVMPISKGGSDYIQNIVPACKPCNSKKGARILAPVAVS